MEAKPGLHQRNLHRNGYDFGDLLRVSPELKAFVYVNKYGARAIDFSDSRAVKVFNQTLLRRFYGVESWDVPENHLCPPVPGRADYVHPLADLLGDGARRVLDIGTGANCIYPLLGVKIYGWSFVATDIDPRALRWAEKIIGSDEGLRRAITLRFQPHPDRIFTGVVDDGDSFAASMCNPPFHASPQDAAKGTLRKWKSLGKDLTTELNFGGKATELWCPGGELAFISRMVKESSEFRDRIRWFTTLVSKESNLPVFQRLLRSAAVRDSRIIEMAQGQKRSRILAWTFRD